MKVSVILTTYNKEDELGRVLEGLALQGTLAHEVIVADDGSGPATKELVSGFQRDFPCRLLHVWQEDKGFRLARIRNKGISASSGDYLLVLDGDCIPTGNFVADHIRLARQGCFVQGKRVLVNREASRSLRARDLGRLGPMLSFYFRGGFSNAHHLIRAPWLPPLKSRRLHGIKGCNMSFFKEDLIAVNGYNEEFTGWGREDSEIATRLFNRGLIRLEHPFMAICFHLWHPQFTREGLEINEEILQRAISSGSVRCARGIEH